MATPFIFWPGYRSGMPCDNAHVRHTAVNKVLGAVMPWDTRHTKSIYRTRYARARKICTSLTFPGLKKRSETGRRACRSLNIVNLAHANPGAPRVFLAQEAGATATSYTHRILHANIKDVVKVGAAPSSVLLHFFA